MRSAVIGVFTAPQGKVAFSNEGVLACQEYVWVQQHTQPAEYFLRCRLPRHELLFGPAQSDADTARSKQRLFAFSF
jgi:hypothetical protein